jgi:hypothetical protein
LRVRTFLSLSLLCLATILGLACGSGAGGSAAKTPTSEPSPPSDALAIHNVDFTQVPAVRTLVAQAGGDVDTQSVLFADLTGDGRDEAAVPIASGGTLGNLAYVVLTMRSGAPAPILTATRDRNGVGGIFMAVEDGKLVKTTGKYGPEDPRCCPSALIKTTYRWDGTNLQVEREEELQQAGGKQ